MHDASWDVECVTGPEDMLLSLDLIQDGCVKFCVQIDRAGQEFGTLSFTRQGFRREELASIGGCERLSGPAPQEA